MNKGVWITPTAGFQIEQYTKRDWVQTILKECQDPNQAFQNWMQRDITFAQFIHKEAQDRDLKSIVVDGSRTLEQNLVMVEEHFKLMN